MPKSSKPASPMEFEDMDVSLALLAEFQAEKDRRRTQNHGVALQIPLPEYPDAYATFASRDSSAFD